MSEAIEPRFHRGPSTTARQAAAVLLGLTLAALPFDIVVSGGVGGFTITPLEAMWALGLGGWVVVLLVERRMPAVPLPVFGALAALALINLASAVLADGHNDEALRFVVRSGAGWLLLLAVADTVRAGAPLRWLAGGIVAGAAIAALLGLTGLALGGAAPDLLAARHNVGGVARLHSPLDYPTTAGMLWAASALMCAPLMIAPGGLRRQLASAAAIVIGGALLLTLSRGPALGLSFGLIVVAAVGLLKGRRAVALAGSTAAAAVLIGIVVVQLVLLPAGRLFDEGHGAIYGARYAAPAALEVRAGEEFTARIEVTNTGEQTWNVEGRNTHTLGWRWLDPLTSRPLRDDNQRARLPAGIEPGETVSVSVRVRAPTEEGEHLIGWEVVHEGVAWFSERSVPVATTRLYVGVAAPQSPPPASGPVELYPDLVQLPERGVLWAAALEMIVERPLLGVGPGTYRLRYGDYLDQPAADERVHSNNTYLELAATTGILGLAAFAALGVYVLLRLLAHLRAANDMATWLPAAAVLGSIAAFLAAGLVDYFLAFNPTGGMFWALAGLGLGLSSGPAGP